MIHKVEATFKVIIPIDDTEILEAGEQVTNKLLKELAKDTINDQTANSGPYELSGEDFTYKVLR